MAAVDLTDSAWQKLHRVIDKSFAVDRHVDFYRWLQDEVRAYLPHDVLVAAWGNLRSGRLNYDIASQISGLRTQDTNGSEIAPFVVDLYRRWAHQAGKWLVLDDYDFYAAAPGRKNTFLARVGPVKGLLVYGIRDRRIEYDCLYVFFNTRSTIAIEASTAELILSLVDSALRRVECMVPFGGTITTIPNSLIGQMSDREHEIMTWVRSGKTNEEIGDILEISVNTVKNHLKRIFKKMDVSSRAQAIVRYESLRQSFPQFAGLNPGRQPNDGT